jgi:hypothetical protein
MAHFDIGADEILSALRPLERREIYEELSEEFGTAGGAKLEGDNLTSTEEDFRQVLCEVWEKRGLLTPEQMKRIASILTEPSVQ